MAIQHGRTGLVHIGSSVAVAHITAWSYSEVVGETETTAMGDTSKSFVGGLKDGTLSVDCHWDEADSGQDAVIAALAAGTAVTVSIYPTGITTAGAVRLTGDIVINNYDVTSGVDAIVTCKFGGRGAMLQGVVPA